METLRRERDRAENEKNVGNVRVDKLDEVLIAGEETLKATKDLNATLLERLDRQLFKFAS